jgi:hypothetical protein
MAGVADRGDRAAFHYPPSGGLGEEQAEWTKLSREVSRVDLVQRVTPLLSARQHSEPYQADEGTH